jgi:hypothetical protein
VHRSNLIIALGLSAIDVLSCALVSSIILFLLFSSPSKSKTPTAEATADVGLLIKIAIDQEEPIVRLRVYPPNPDDEDRKSLPVEFWSDLNGQSAKGLGEIRSLYESDGSAIWVPSSTSETKVVSVAGTSPEAALFVHRPKSGRWRLELGYMTSRSDLAAPHLPKFIDANVTIAASCLTKVRSRLELGVPRVIDDAEPPEDGKANSCSLNEALFIQLPSHRTDQR